MEVGKKRGTEGEPISLLWLPSQKKRKVADGEEEEQFLIADIPTAEAATQPRRDQ